MTTKPQQAGLTSEEDIASYLISTPEFFDRFAEVLSSIQLPSPHGGRAVSLQERQVAILREKIKGLEATIVEMMGYGTENAQIIQKAHDWTAAMLKERNAAALPGVLAMQLQKLFDVPQVYLRLWELEASYAGLPEVQLAHPDNQPHIATLEKPYCGPRGSVEGLQKLAGAEADLSAVQSIAILPLRAGRHPAARLTFGYLLLTSPDMHRFSPAMGVELLVRLADLASAAMQRLLPLATLERLEQQAQAAEKAEQAEQAEQNARAEPADPAGKTVPAAAQAPESRD
ncbi:DUF484 family protein [Corticibacter populi]|uniref:DUF484 family protein n=1 Tax=Corticibacter populi TaxID=1550736 RepID=A0A3M6QY70_9BURK|nr:DUF484 family protein [Corticibacter populi]RMX07944.1 DUF484 family protein [Corticibacter populi]RZS35184.1 hypothetical protein EV687_0243 [Corticibacter populi]